MIIAVGDALGNSAVVDLHIWSEGINDQGQVAFWASLADGTQGIYRADPPINVDSDEDGLLDADEELLGTDPNDPDSDDDGLLDGTEVQMADGGTCPDPLDADSDSDNLLDGEEVILGTNTCSSDTDGDNVPDDVDPLPTEPGVSSGYLEDELRYMAEDTLLLDLSLFSGPNNNANKGRRNSLSNRSNSAANAVADNDYQKAIDTLSSMLQKVDGEDVPPDWMEDSTEKNGLANQIRDLIDLIEYMM